MWDSLIETQEPQPSTSKRKACSWGLECGLGSAETQQKGFRFRRAEWLSIVPLTGIVASIAEKRVEHTHLHWTRQPLLLTHRLHQPQHLHLSSVLSPQVSLGVVLPFWLLNHRLPWHVECLALFWSDRTTLHAQSCMLHGNLRVTAVTLAFCPLPLHLSWRGVQMLTGWCWLLVLLDCLTRHGRLKGADCSHEGSEVSCERPKIPLQWRQWHAAAQEGQGS